MQFIVVNQTIPPNIILIIADAQHAVSLVYVCVYFFFTIDAVVICSVWW